MNRIVLYVLLLLTLLVTPSFANGEWEWTVNPYNPFNPESGTARTKGDAVAQMQSACNACPYFTDEQFDGLVGGGKMTYRYLPEGGPDPEYTEWEYSYSFTGFGKPPTHLTASSLGEVVDWIRDQHPDQLDPRCAPTKVEVDNNWTFAYKSQLPTQEMLCSAPSSRPGTVLLFCDDPGVKVILESYDASTQVCKEREEKYVPARRRVYTCEVGFLRSIKTEDGITTPICIPGQQGFVTGPRPNSSCEGGDETTNNPCSPLTGEKLKSVMDFDVNGLTFSRHYSSLHSVNAPVIGNSWRHSYHDRLLISRNNAVVGRISENNQFVQVGGSPGAGYKPVPANYRGLGKIDVVDNNFLARMTNGDTRVYDDKGRLREIQRKSGRKTQLSYLEDRLVRIENEFGLSLELAYEGDKISQLIQPDGAVIKYQYDALGNLHKVIYPDLTEGDDTDNPALVYHYEDARFRNHLTGISDENGIRTQTYRYDEAGKALTSEKAQTSNALGQEKVQLDYHGGP